MYYIEKQDKNQVICFFK